MQVFYKIHVYQDGDIEFQKVDEKSKVINTDDVFIPIENKENLRNELLDYGVNDERVEEVLEEIEEMRFLDTINV